MIDPSKYQSFQPITELAASKLDKVALNPQPLPPKAGAYADGAVVAPRSDAVSLNPQPLPPKESALGFITVNPAAARLGISIEGLPQQLGNLVGDVLSKVALNPQPLPPKAVGNIFADVLSKVGIIIVSGKTDKVTEQNPEPEDPQARGGAFDGKAIAAQAAHANRFEQAGIIIVSGKTDKVTEEDPDGDGPQARRPAFALQSIAAEALHSIIEQAVERAAKGERGAKGNR